MTQPCCSPQLPITTMIKPYAYDQVQWLLNWIPHNVMPKPSNAGIEPTPLQSFAFHSIHTDHSNKFKKWRFLGMQMGPGPDCLYYGHKGHKPNAEEERGPIVIPMIKLIHCQKIVLSNAFQRFESPVGFSRNHTFNQSVCLWSSSVTVEQPQEVLPYKFIMVK